MLTSTPSRRSALRPAGAALAITLVAGLLVALTATPGAAARQPTLSISPSTGAAGSVMRLTGRVPTRAGARPVVLQRKAGARWTRVARGRTAARGTFRFTTTRRSTATTYRVVAPRVRARGLRKVVTPTRRTTVVRPVPPTLLVSTRPDGTRSGGQVSYAVLSRDGRRTAFVTNAQDLVPGADTNVEPDVYWKDRATGATRLISVGTNERAVGLTGGNPSSFRVDLSDDGRYVVFSTSTGGLVGSPTAANREHVYLRDAQAGTTTLVSPAGPSYLEGGFNATISGDGRYVFYSATPTNPGGARVLVRYDRTTGDRVVLTPFGADAPHQQLAASRTGRFVAISSRGPSADGEPFLQVWLYDATEDITVLASAGADGPSETDCQDLSISDEGRFLAFECNGIEDSPSSGLLRGVTGPLTLRWDRDTDTLDLVSRSADGRRSLLGRTPRISGNGRYVAWLSVQPQALGGRGAGEQALVWDAATGRNSLASTAPDGQRSPGRFFGATISGDSATVGFWGSNAARQPGGPAVPNQLYVRAR